MMDIQFGVTETVATVSSGIVILGMVIRKWLSSVNFDISNNNAGVHMIEQMRIEILRMAEANATLMQQVENLRHQNNLLHEEVRNLTITLTELQEHQLKKCSKCKMMDQNSSSY